MLFIAFELRFATGCLPLVNRKRWHVFAEIAGGPVISAAVQLILMSEGYFGALKSSVVPGAAPYLNDNQLIILI